MIQIKKSIRFRTRVHWRKWLKSVMCKRGVLREGVFKDTQKKYEYIYIYMKKKKTFCLRLLSTCWSTRLTMQWDREDGLEPNFLFSCHAMVTNDRNFWAQSVACCSCSFVRNYLFNHFDIINIYSTEQENKKWHWIKNS